VVPDAAVVSVVSPSAQAASTRARAVNNAPHFKVILHFVLDVIRSISFLFVPR
jgi:hypothetical protein